MTDRSSTLYSQATRETDGYYSRLELQSGNSPRVNGVLKFRQNAMVHTEVNGYLSPRPWYKNQSTSPYTVSGYGDVRQIQPLLTSLTDKLRIRSESDSKLRSKLGGVAINLAEVYATRQQTVDTVVSRLQKIVRGALAIKKFRFKEARRIFGNPKRRQKLGRDFTGNWLEFQYGWKPLYGDIFTLLDTPFPQVFGIAKANAEIVGRERYNFKSAGVTQTGSIETRLTGMSRIKIELAGSAMGAISQVGLNNPLLVAWELVPFSFAVDWFYPVGNYLEGLGAYKGLLFLDYSYTEKRFSEWSYQGQNHLGSRYQKQEFQSAHGSVLNKTRSLTGFEVNPLPRFGNGLTLTKFSIALSIMTQLFKGKR